MPETSAKLLADIGGTNARFAVHVEGKLLSERVLACNDYPDLGAAIRNYLDGLGADVTRPTMAALAVAAPLHGDLVRMTNHVWQFSVASVRRELNFRRLIVLNDFTALALSLRHLPRSELQQIGGASAVADAPIALIGPGTGLGVSGLIPTGAAWLPLQGEGGHVTLAAMNDREAAMLAVLRARFDHVSAERVLSGPGLVNLYEALCMLDGEVQQTLSPAEITERALANADTSCRAALEMFCAMLGTVASNLALTLGAVGGVYIGGGIVPRLGDFFVQSKFRQRFEDKGRYKAYLEPIPAMVIHSALPAFVGLASAFDSPAPHVEG
jgi:glucokinase